MNITLETSEDCKFTLTEKEIAQLRDKLYMLSDEKSIPGIYLPIYRNSLSRDYLNDMYIYDRKHLDAVRELLS